MKKNLVSKDSGISINRQLSLLSISKGGFYYVRKGEPVENLEMMRLMDQHITEDPTASVLIMQAMLEENGYKAGYERVRRLIRLADIVPIYPGKQLTVLGEKKYINPYLLKNLKVERSNQIWERDITYVPMKQGFMYLTAIIDVFSRKIVSWGLSNLLDAESSLRVVRSGIEINGKPEILNSDQGSQFTCLEYTNLLKRNKIQISMDGKGRALDNIYIKRFWRSIKYRHINLNPAQDGLELYRGIDLWIDKYNNRKHQVTGKKPEVKHRNAA